MNLAETYQRLRSGRTFFIGMGFFGLSYAYFHFARHLDQDYGLYNTILSTEASLNGTVIVIMAEKFEAWVREQIAVLREILGAVLSAAKQLLRIVDLLIGMDARLSRLEAAR